MDTTQLLSVFRAEIDDTEEKYLVSDELFYVYLDDAQKWFCRLTEGVEDARRQSVQVSPGVEWYSLNKNVLKVRAAYRQSTGDTVPVIASELALQRGMRFDGTSGPLKAFVSGAEKGQLRAWPKPVAAESVDLHVFRLPATLVPDAALEIDEQHHLALLMWVKHKAYGIQDSELSDARKSIKNESDFRAYCAKARVEQGRARHDAGSVMYGGI